MPALQQSCIESRHDAAPAATSMLFDFVEVAQPEEDPNGRIFIPSRAATPEPYSPRSRPIALKSPSERSSPPLYEPYPTPTTTPRKRVRPAGNKRSVNAFLIYRREFPTRYPHIDALEKHQGPKSSIIGAMWRAEPLDVKEYFFRLQAAADEEFRKAHGTSDAPRADPVKTLMRRERARQRRTRDEKLAPRSELIVKLWMEKKSVSEFVRAVHEYDEQSKATAKPEQAKMKAFMASSPLSNHTNTPMDADVPLPTTPALQIQTTFMTCVDMPQQSSSPADSPVVRTPSPLSTPHAMVTAPEQDVEHMSMDQSFASFEDKHPPQPFDIAYFSALLELVPPNLGAVQMMPPAPDADALMAQLFPSSSSSSSSTSFSAPAPLWNGIDGEFGGLPTPNTDFVTYAANGDVVSGWAAYTDGTFDFEHATGVYTFGSQEDLSGLETYGSLVEPVENLVDSYVEMSCLPL